MNCLLEATSLTDRQRSEGGGSQERSCEDGPCGEFMNYIHVICACGDGTSSSVGGSSPRCPMSN